MPRKKRNPWLKLISKEFFVLSLIFFNTSSSLTCPLLNDNTDIKLCALWDCEAFLKDWFGCLKCMAKQSMCLYLQETRRKFLGDKVFRHVTNARATYICGNHIFWNGELSRCKKSV